MNTFNKTFVTLLAVCSLVFSQASFAKSHSHEGYKSHHKYQKHHHRHKKHHNHQKRYGNHKRYHHHDHYHNKRRYHYRHGTPWCPSHYTYHYHSSPRIGQIVGGVALGAIIASAINNKSRKHRVVKDYQVEQNPTIIFRQTQNGKCFQVFYNEQGDEYLTPVPRENCGSY